jgi:hypothetical protein
MIVTVEGTYKNGKVELAETPANVTQAKVLVTFLPQSVQPRPGTPMRFGQFAGPKQSTEEDFRIAEWRGEKE